MRREIERVAMRFACLFVACAAVRAAAYQLVEVGDGETAPCVGRRDDRPAGQRERRG